jgi:2-oxoglutarate ferredoxin oxidoreductase subunit beta
VVEVIAHCHTQYGRLNKMGGPVEMLEWQRDHAVSVERAANIPADDLKDKFLTGVLIDRDLPVYQREYDRIRARAKEEDQ